MQKQREIALESILKLGMIPVERRRDILKVRLLTREEKKSRERGSADVLCVSPLGRKTILSRQFIREHFTYLNGKLITFSGWKEGKVYYISRIDNTPAAAMVIPLGYTLVVKGVRANSSNKRNRPDYLVGLLKENGELDIDSLGIVTSDMYKKMFYTSSSSLKSWFKGKTVQGKKEDISPENSRDRLVSHSESGHSEEASRDVGNESVKSGEHTIKTSVTEENTSKKSKYLYYATARLVNSEGKLVGFMIQEESGRTAKVTMSQMIELCRHKTVANIMLARSQETGKMFLRGNNMRIDNLSEYRV